MVCGLQREGGRGNKREIRGIDGCCVSKTHTTGGGARTRNITGNQQSKYEYLAKGALILRLPAKAFCSPSLLFR